MQHRSNATKSVSRALKSRPLLAGLAGVAGVGLVVGLTTFPATGYYLLDYTPNFT